MFADNQIKPFQTAVNEAKSIVIALPPDPSADLVASGLGLYLSLKSHKDQVNIGCSSDIKVSHASLFGIDKIKSSIGNQNLIISLKYPEAKLDKIDYQAVSPTEIELQIKPRPGEKAPTSDKINFHFSGAKADLVFILGVQSLTELGKLYADEKKFFDTTQNVSINTTVEQSDFSALSFHTPKATSVAEITAFLLKTLNFEPTSDAATNLLNSIIENSSNFNSQKTTADTFEIVAFLFRSGGKRISPQPFGFVPQKITSKTFDQSIPQEWIKPKIFRSPSQSSAPTPQEAASGSTQPQTAPLNPTRNLPRTN